jgi:hypothetical protein
MRYMGRMKVEKDVEPVLSDEDIETFFKRIGPEKKGTKG